MASRSERAGELLRRHVDVSSNAAEHAALRVRTVEKATRKSGRATVRLAGLVAAGAALVLLLAVWLRQPSDPAPLAFHVGLDHRRGEVGAYYAAPGAAALSFSFSDGSVVELEAGSGARVSHADAHGAAILLETGAAVVTVPKRPGADWKIHAGPYLVRVVGTEFRIRWEAATGTLELQMRSGSVVVQGPGVEGVAIGAGERFVSQASARVERPAPSAQQQAALTQVPSPASEPKGERETVDAARPPREPSLERDGGSMPPSWSALIRRGDYAAVLRDAERRGLDTALGASSAEELSALADAARFSGRRDLARRALLAQRKRFPGSSQAVAAAFVLGRMLDESGDTSGALAFYDRYLAEAPAGSLAGEALGRRMLALKRLGNPAATRAAAELYLRRFPAGAYGAVAKELVTP